MLLSEMKLPKNFLVPLKNGALSYDDRLFFALLLRENPNEIIFDANDNCYWTYNLTDDAFYYSKPDNPKRNGWYKARGLQSFYDSYIKMLQRNTEGCFEK